MNWDLAIERHRKQLLRIVAGLFALIGLSEGSTIERLAWPLYRAVLRVLRPAEAAVRRLIMVAARDIVVEPLRKHSASKGRKRKRSGTRQGRKSFQLFDPPKRGTESYRHRTSKSKVVRAEPCIRVLDFDPRVPWFARPGATAPAPAAKPKPRDTVNAQPLCRRLLALQAALHDMAAQARRYARWRARPMEERRPKRASPLRPGNPPGYAKRPTHKVHDILAECHWLANTVPQPDTS